jgi:hypothetical protein
VPRAKSSTQILGELQTLYDLGYRGHVDLVDDNFIGNKKLVKAFLPELKAWLEEHDWPFEFTTEASINLADDPELMRLMQEVGFFAIFVGIESPDEASYRHAKRRTRTGRSPSITRSTGMACSSTQGSSSARHGARQRRQRHQPHRGYGHSVNMVGP